LSSLKEQKIYKPKAMLNDLFFDFKIRNIIIVILKNNGMEANNLGSKKINGVQKNIDESKGKNISHDGKSEDANLKKEVVTDAQGNKQTVERARNENEDIRKVKDNVNLNDSNANRGVSTEDEAKKTVENKDRNSDITPNRYPNSNPESHEDRGNMKLDDEN
jgi:hypothetical protein